MAAADRPARARRLLGGDRGGAQACLDWVAAQAADDGELPEQTQHHLLAPAQLEPWVERWGPPPRPLLWSHAMFLDLAVALDA